MTLVTQLGAVSVTNPELVNGETPQPEVMSGNIYDFGSGPQAFFDIRQHSSLVPIAGYVMTYDADYVTLGNLLAAVGDAWADEVTDGKAYVLDFEYKKVVAMGDRPEHLEVKQVRPLPMADNRRSIAPFFLPEAPRELCMFQGEYGSIFGNHRIKARVTLEHVVGFLDEAALATTVFSSFAMTATNGAHPSGPLAGFPAYAHTAPTFDEWGNPTASVDQWTRGAGAGLELWKMETTGPWLVSPAEAPIVVLDDLSVAVNVTYTTPQVEPDMWPDGTTLFDGMILATCPEDTVLTPAFGKINRRVGVKDVNVDIGFWWPPAPSGAVAGYTAPLAKWDVTTISGLTTAPIELRGFWSQTYRPGHHNFGEDFMFEPALEEGIDQATLDELEALDIKALWVRWGWDTGAIQIVGLDGKIREL